MKTLDQVPHENVRIDNQYDGTQMGYLSFLNGLGWLTALALACVLFIPYIFA